jgi:CheY-like chemotaxis protein
MNNELLRIVLADDDASDRSNFMDAFEELKIKTSVHTVRDGVELMDYLADESAPLPYLLFLDLNMPRKNGLECLKEIRSNNRFKDVIVAIYSTSSSERDIDATFASGANVYIKKPNDFASLKAVLDKVVKAAYVYREPPFNLENFIFKL